MNSHTSTCSPESQGLLWPREPTASEPSPSAKSSATFNDCSGDISPTFQSFPTSTGSMADGSEASLWSLAGIPASLSALPGSSSARQITVTSGRRCAVLYPRRSPIGRFVRTLLESTAWNSTIVYLTWKPSATKLRHRLKFQLVPWTRNTDGCGSGLWLTPNAMDSLEIRSDEALRRQRENNRPNRSTHSTLREQVSCPPPAKLWPTPTESDGNSSGNRNGNPQSKAHQGTSLTDAVRMWPTPAAREWKGARKPETLALAGRNETNSLSDAVAHAHGLKRPSGSLSPAWEEWLMGYPTGWTDLKHSETPSSRRSPLK